MKMLYRKGTVHPSPPFLTDHLSFLPAAILTLAAALSPEDREVLSYLISCSNNNNFSGNSHQNKTATVGDHAPIFRCSCFRCYMSYWVRWDSSPNRQLIHEIIDEFEDWLAQQNSNKGKEKRNNKNKKKKRLNNNKKKQSELVGTVSNVSSELESVKNSSSSSSGNNSEGGDKVKEEEEEKEGPVIRFVTFIGQSIWSALGQ